MVHALVLPMQHELEEFSGGRGDAMVCLDLMMAPSAGMTHLGVSSGLV